MFTNISRRSNGPTLHLRDGPQKNSIAAGEILCLE
jgi:hypothetical protein